MTHLDITEIDLALATVADEWFLKFPVEPGDIYLSEELHLDYGHLFLERFPYCPSLYVHTQVYVDQTLFGYSLCIQSNLETTSTHTLNGILPIPITIQTPSAPPEHYPTTAKEIANILVEES